MKKVFLITLFLFSSFKVYPLEVTLTQGSVKPTPIAVTELYSKNTQLTKVGKNISTVISDNLERSGLFLPIDKRSFIQDNESLVNKPRFEDWKLIKAQHLVSGKISSNNGLQCRMKGGSFIIDQRFKRISVENMINFRVGQISHFVVG